MSERSRTICTELIATAIKKSPEYSVSQILTTILRKKSGLVASYDWTDEHLVDVVRGYLLEINDNPQD